MGYEGAESLIWGAGLGGELGQREIRTAMTGGGGGNELRWRPVGIVAVSVWMEERRRRGKMMAMMETDFPLLQTRLLDLFATRSCSQQ